MKKSILIIVIIFVILILIIALAGVLFMMNKNNDTKKENYTFRLDLQDGFYFDNPVQVYVNEDKIYDAEVKTNPLIGYAKSFSNLTSKTNIVKIRVEYKSMNIGKEFTFDLAKGLYIGINGPFYSEGKLVYDFMARQQNQAFSYQ